MLKGHVSMIVRVLGAASTCLLFLMCVDKLRVCITDLTHSDGLAELHTQIRTCDFILESMQQMYVLVCWHGGGGRIRGLLERMRLFHVPCSGSVTSKTIWVTLARRSKTCRIVVCQ